MANQLAQCPASLAELRRLLGLKMGKMRSTGRGEREGEVITLWSTQRSRSGGSFSGDADATALTMRLALLGARATGTHSSLGRPAQPVLRAAPSLPRSPAPLRPITQHTFRHTCVQTRQQVGGSAVTAVTDRGRWRWLRRWRRGEWRTTRVRGRGGSAGATLTRSQYQSEPCEGSP